MGAIKHRNLRNIDEIAPLTDMRKDVTERKTKSRFGNSTKRPQEKGRLQRGQLTVGQEVEFVTEGLADYIATQGGSAERGRSTTIKGEMHVHAVRVHAEETMRPFEGSETTDGKIDGEVAVGDIVSSQGRDSACRKRNHDARSCRSGFSSD